jgi:hypothetical protein
MLDRQIIKIVGNHTGIAKKLTNSWKWFEYPIGFAKKIWYDIVAVVINT